MSISHIFFTLHGTLVDSRKLRLCYAVHLGQIMAHHYGKTADLWTQAYQHIIDDWDSYYADLDLAGADGLPQLREGLFRTTRALFRLTDTPEPSHDDLTTLASELPARVHRHCNGLYPEVKTVIEQLHGRGYHMGIITHMLTGQAGGMLIGGDILPYFQDLLIGADILEQVDQDERCFETIIRLAGISPKSCMVVDHQLPALAAAHRVGLSTVWLNRTASPVQNAHVSYVLTGDLSAIIHLLP